jgi:predicted TIM-barrel fold metal-dependent hydrolase
VGFIDCDSHVLECSATWSYLDPSERIFEPRVATFDQALTGGLAGAPPTKVWIIGDTWARYFPSDGDFAGNANAYDIEATHLTNTATRLEDLDALGIDVQVILSSAFISVEIDNPLAEAALTRSFNRWLAEIVGDKSDRLPWIARAPLRIIDRACEEILFAKEHGAVGVHLRGLEHGMFLSDPYFYPVYELAQDLDLAMVVHLGEATRRADSQPIGRLIHKPEAFMNHLSRLMVGFNSVISADFDRRFPRLRWGFLEAGATFCLTVLQQTARLESSAGDFLKVAHLTAEQLESKNIFVTCQADEDIPYLAKMLGENLLVTGTDYGHNDSGAELGVHRTICRRTDLDPAIAAKIVDTNGRRLYGIDPGFRPAQSTNVEVGPPHVRRAGTTAEPALLS